MSVEQPKILLIDSYDSFTFNLAALIRLSIPNCNIHIIKNDQLSITQLLPHLQHFSAIVVGPGPGSPDNPQDIGVVKDLWSIADEDLLPIFGVCLGLQSLCVEHGQPLKRLKVVKHGQISDVLHTGTDLFAGVHSVKAVRYHSLHAEVLGDGDILPTAWVDDGLENGRVVMAVKHKSRPFWAVQYHPESVKTDGGGLEVLQNFWRLSQKWSLERNRQPVPETPVLEQVMGRAWPDLHISHQTFTPEHEGSISKPRTVTSHTIRLRHLNMVAICELFGAADEKSSFALLDSAAQGRFSIIASLSPDSLHVSHSVDDPFLRLRQNGANTEVDLEGRDVWKWVAAFMRTHKATGGSPDIPFWGGFIGLMTYELGVHELDVSIQKRSKDKQHPDMNLVFVERSIVIDTHTNNVTVQSLHPDDHGWIIDTCIRLAEATQVPEAPFSRDDYPLLTRPVAVTMPEKAHYIDQINECKEYLFSGDSYELCLTAQTYITSTAGPSWDRYKALRNNNPAPHSAYIRLNPTIFLSSSPERFLSFSRSPGTLCQLRPIKGTVRKGPGVTRTFAENALSGSIKEVAENLMIVDLIRHDLHGVVGEDVQVKKFCVIEEYETVYQLVSVIEGKLGDSSLADPTAEDQLGWEVLQKSLPPGSMTGAPKKRSVDLLQTIEDSDRAIYSGVFGYWCVSGGGDWAVTIRSCYKYDENPGENWGGDNKEEWRIGAGGAITALSDADAEWEEMCTKLQSVLRSFGIKSF